MAAISTNIQKDFLLNLLILNVIIPAPCSQ